MKLDPIDEKEVRHAGDSFSFPMWKAFRCAFSGMAYSIVTQRNFRIHLLFAILALVLGAILDISEAGWYAVIICIASVFALEVVNTAIESFVDMASPEWNELAMRAKDCAAGAVLVAAIGSVIIAALVYTPHIVDFIVTFK